MDVKVSVVIATHNHAHFLPECLGSVKAQTYKDYEVIVVNNGSTDNTEEAVRRLSWERLCYLYQEDTGSVASPRNSGIRRARGEYIAFLDSDDLWYEKKLEKVMSILASDKDIDIISHDMLVKRGGIERNVVKVGPLRKDMFAALLRRNCLLGSATVVKKKVLEEVGGFSELKDFVHAEDYNTWLDIAYRGRRFAFINETLGVLRFHSANLSLDFQTHICNIISVINRQIKKYREGSIFWRLYLYRTSMSIIYSSAAVQYIFRKKYLRAIRYFITAGVYNPFESFLNIFLIIKDAAPSRIRLTLKLKDPYAK